MRKSQKKSSLSKGVLDKIETGQVKMRPRIHFVLKSLLITLGLILTTLFALYLISFVVFVLRTSGVFYLPGFGFPGLKIFLISFPWLLIFIAIILIIVIEILVKHFSFAYRRPILYSLLGILILVFVGSFIVYRTQLHSGLFERAEEGRLPVAGPLYKGYGMPEFEDVHHGIVSEITDNGFMVEESDGQILNIVVSPETRFPSGKNIKENDLVMILGEQDNGKLNALGIRKINNGFKGLPRHRMHMRPSNK